MFSRQIGAFAQMYSIPGVPKPFVDALIRIFTNCSQTLEHRGDVIINGDKITNLVTTTSATAEVLWAVATANWTNNAGNASYVDCDKASDRDGTLTSGTVRVYLPRSSGSDPNVRTGDVIGYLADAAGDAIVATDVNDDPIGTIKWWSGLPENVPGGWWIETTLATKVVVGFDALQPRFAVMHATGGDATEVPAHPSVYSFEADGGWTDWNHAPIAIGSAGAKSGIATGGTEGAHVEGWLEATTLTIEGHGMVDTTKRTTGITIDNHYTHTHLVPAHPFNANAGFSPMTWPDQDGIYDGTIDSFVTTSTESTVLAHQPWDAAIHDPGHFHTVSVSKIARNLTIESVNGEGEVSEPGEHTHGIGLSPAEHAHTFASPYFLNAHTHDNLQWRHRHYLGLPHSHAIPAQPHIDGGNYMPMCSQYFIRRVS